MVLFLAVGRLCVSLSLSLSFSLSSICRVAASASPVIHSLLRVIVFNGGTLYTDTVQAACSRSHSSDGSVPATAQEGADSGGEWSAGALITIVLRLGLDKLEAEAVPALAFLLTLPQCVGVLGGTPSHSIYVVGTRAGREAVFLDPHTTQAAVGADAAPVEVAVDAEEGELECGSFPAVTTSETPSVAAALLPQRYVSTFMPPAPRYTPLASLDPSLAVAFHCGGREDFAALCDSLRATPCPLFDIAAREPVYELSECRCGCPDPCECECEGSVVSALATPDDKDWSVAVCTPLVFQEECVDEDGFIVVHQAVGMSEAKSPG